MTSFAGQPQRKSFKTRLTLTGIALVLACGVGLFVLRPWEASTPELFPEFQMFPSARTFDAPGTVFRIDTVGIRYDVADISKQLPSIVGSETIPEITGRRKLTGQAIADFFSRKISASGSGSRSYDVVLKISGAEREKTTDTDIDKILGSALKQVRIRPDSRYFLIRETIAAREIIYELNSSAAADAKFDGQSAGASVSMSESSGGGMRLAVTFPSANRIFYKPEEIIVTSSGITGDVAVTRAPVLFAVQWTGLGNSN